MKSRRIKQILALTLSLFLAGGSVTSLAAADNAADNTVDFSRTGTISVTLKTEDIAIAGAKLTAYQVADADNQNNGLSFSFTKSFADFEGSPDQLQNTEEIKRLSDYIKEKNISGISAVTDSSGYAVFDSLPLGLYIVVQTGSVEGFSDCSPFIAAIPICENGAWSYDIDATPKTNIEKLVNLSVMKVWNDGNSEDRVDSVTVQLCRGESVVDTAVLSEENNWSYTWQNIPNSDDYTVKEENIPNGYTATYGQDGYVFTVTNTSSLIQTGQINWPIPVLTTFGLVLIAAGLFLLRRKNNHA